MIELMKQEGVEVDLSSSNMAIISFNGQSWGFDYPHKDPENSDEMKADALIFLLADSSVLDKSFGEFNRDCGGNMSIEQYEHEKFQTRQLKRLLGGRWNAFLQQYNTAQ